MRQKMQVYRSDGIFPSRPTGRPRLSGAAGNRQMTFPEYCKGVTGPSCIAAAASINKVAAVPTGGIANDCSFTNFGTRCRYASAERCGHSNRRRSARPREPENHNDLSQDARGSDIRRKVNGGPVAEHRFPTGALPKASASLRAPRPRITSKWCANDSQLILVQTPESWQSALKNQGVQQAQHNHRNS
jgi:hypothetical protein